MRIKWASDFSSASLDCKNTVRHCFQNVKEQLSKNLKTFYCQKCSSLTVGVQSAAFLARKSAV